MAKGPPRSVCPITQTLDVIGDKWSLLVVRDLLLGKSKFSEFLDSPEGVTTNILADRLRRLEAEGLISRSLYQQRPDRYAYALTEAGQDLKPVISAICRWAEQWRPEAVKAPETLLED
jgi:DNA-binding HxlR family transcriptional regulator